jgi:membrane protease YdiL (CAAX protease family)
MLQQRIVGVPQAVIDSAKTMAVTFELLPAASVFVLIAVVPAVCEELLFRGFLLSSLRTSARKWTAIIAAAAIFGVFHFFLFKFAVTASLGVLLGYLCWQSRSVVPAIIAHLLHNSIGVSNVLYRDFARRLGVPQGDDWVHLPAGILILGGAVFLVGILMTVRPTTRQVEQPLAV